MLIIAASLKRLFFCSFVAMINRFTFLSLLALSFCIASCGGDKSPEDRAADSLRVLHEIITRDSTELAAIPEPDTGGTARWTANSRSSRHEVTEAAMLGDVRTSTNPEYDRIVFVFRSAQLPNWKIGYVGKDITTCGEGAPVTLSGKAWLQINLEPCNAHDTAGHTTTAWREKTFTYRSIEAMKQICDFEAVTTWVAGLRTAAKYRVIELKDPTRLVVDVENSGR